MNHLCSCDHMHEVKRSTDSGKEWNYAAWPGDINFVIGGSKTLN